MPNATTLAIAIAALPAGHAAPAVDPAASEARRPEPDAATPALTGAELFATYCATCHKPANLARGLQSAPDPEAAEAEMAAFLTRHGRSGGDADAAIVDYLARSSFR